MDTAEVYLLITRPTGVPILGEAVPLPFTGQIELNSWSWNLNNQEEVEKAEADAQEYSKREAFIKSRPGATRRLAFLQEDNEYAKQKLAKDRDAKLDRLTDKDNANRRDKILKDYDEAVLKADRAMSKNSLKLFGLEQDESAKDAAEIEAEMRAKIEEARGKELAELERNKNLEFTFSKRVDVASTQMLNSMKAGDVFPVAIISIYHRSTNAPLSLIITVQNMRLLDYSLDVEVSDTMSDMKEEWRAEFSAFQYIYQNKPIVSTPTSASQLAPQMVSQGQTRVFVMNVRKLLGKLMK